MTQRSVVCHKMVASQQHAWQEVLNCVLNSSSLLRQLPFASSCKEYVTSEGHVIKPTEVFRDLGVLLSSDRSWSPHIEQTVLSAGTMAVWALNVFKDRSPFIMMTLLKTMAKNKLKYCCPVWSPTKVQVIKALENVQRNFTKVVGCHDLDYWERLKKLKLLSLQRKWERYCHGRQFGLKCAGTETHSNVNFSEVLVTMRMHSFFSL